MSPTDAPVADDTTSFADYVQTENAKERADPPEAVTPEVVPTDAPPLADVPAAEAAPEAPADGPAAPEQPRAKDGTFKKVSNTGEWARNRTLTAKLRETEAELARLRQPQAPAAPASAPVAPAAPGPPPWHDPADPEPEIDKYLDRADPYAALAVEAAKWAVRDAQRQIAAQQQQAAREEARREVEARITDFAAAHPDYQEKVAALDDVKFAPAVLESLAEDDNGPALVYYLASHPDEARRIAALTPVTGVKEVGKLSVRVAPAPSGSGAAAVPVSRAKPPIKPVGSSPMTPAGALDPETTDFADWVRHGNAADRQRRRDGL